MFAFDMYKPASIVKHVSLMALNLTKKVTIYTNGDDAVANDIETNASFSEAHEKNVTIEKRRIKSVRMASSDSSDVLVTLEDGTELKESFVVRRKTSPFHNA